MKQIISMSALQRLHYASDHHALLLILGYPLSVASDARSGRQLGLQRVDGISRLVLLGVAHDSVRDEQHQDDEEVGPVLHRTGQDHRDLDHPRDRAPEVAEELQKRVRSVLGDLVRAVLGQALLRLGLAQPVRLSAQLLLDLGHGHRCEVVLLTGRRRRLRVGRAGLIGTSRHGRYPPSCGRLSLLCVAGARNCVAADPHSGS